MAEATKKENLKKAHLHQKKINNRKLKRKCRINSRLKKRYGIQNSLSFQMFILPVIAIDFLVCAHPNERCTAIFHLLYLASRS